MRVFVTPPVLAGQQGFSSVAKVIVTAATITPRLIAAVRALDIADGLEVASNAAQCAARVSALCCHLDNANLAKRAEIESSDGETERAEIMSAELERRADDARHERLDAFCALALESDLSEAQLRHYARRVLERQPVGPGASLEARTGGLICSLRGMSAVEFAERVKRHCNGNATSTSNRFFEPDCSEDAPRATVLDDPAWTAHVESYEAELDAADEADARADYQFEEERDEPHSRF